MITVAILINGQPIMSRSAVNQQKHNKRGQTLYIADDGNEVWHKRSEGAVILAQKLLDLIVEPTSSEPEEKP